ncbi:unnamed protein product [Discosporangium mesarthrocarpum]
MLGAGWSIRRPSFKVFQNNWKACFSLSQAYSPRQPSLSRLAAFSFSPNLNSVQGASFVWTPSTNLAWKCCTSRALKGELHLGRVHGDRPDPGWTLAGLVAS